MKGKCPKCKAVFEIKPGLSLIHLGPWRLTKCPTCGKSSMMNNFVNDPITYPPEDVAKPEAPPMSVEELERKRLEDSKYEQRED
jgi:hypothetical protein